MTMRLDLLLHAVDINLHHLSKRYGSEEMVDVTPIVHLEEVSVVRVSARESGSITLQPHERIVRLGGEITVTEGVVQWSQEISALHLIQHDMAQATSGLTTDLTAHLISPLELTEA